MYLIIIILCNVSNLVLMFTCIALICHIFHISDILEKVITITLILHWFFSAYVTKFPQFAVYDTSSALGNNIVEYIG